MLESLRSIDPIAIITVVVALLGAVTSLWSVGVSRRKGIKDGDIADSQITLEQLKLAHTVKDTLLTQVIAENSRLLNENERLRNQRDELEAELTVANQQE